MELELERTQFRLPENQPLRVLNGNGVIVRCLEGIAWLTVEGEAGDCFLGPGEEHRITSKGLALIEGIKGSATIRLEVASSRRANAQPVLKMKSPHWVRRLAT
ncbi:MAG TPA: DUF2917 domain-containing protein [Rhodocyclaceae bacterium]|nr:DUF2917 domain-containing protein [Rhodocyclaceae bacterium]